MCACASTKLPCTCFRQAKRAGYPAMAASACSLGDVDAVYAELAARGARIVKPPQDYDYGMRDFDLIDLDGNQLTFGTGSAA